MKKVALSFLGLLAIGSMAFAFDVPVTAPANASLTGSGSATFGYDLDKGTYGINNESSASFSLDFLSGASAKKGEEGGVISVDSINLKFAVASGSNTLVAGTDPYNYQIAAPTVKIVMGPLYVQLAGVTNPSLDIAGDSGVLFQKASGTYGTTADYTPISNGATVDPNANAAGGLEIGYTLAGLAKITAQVATESDWTAAKGTAQTFEYKGQFDLDSALIAGLSFGAAYVGSTKASTDSGAGVSVGYKLGDLLAATVAADLNLGSTSATGALITLTSSPVKGLNIKSVTGYSTVGTAAAVIGEGVTLGVTKDLLGVASIDVGYALGDISATTSDLYAGVVVTPLEGVDLTGKVYMHTATTSTMFLKAGLALSKLVPNVTFNVNYDSNDFNGTADTLGLVSVKASVAF